MTGIRRAVTHPDRATLAAGIAARLTTTIMDVLAEQPTAHVVVTGGSTGTSGLAALARQPLLHAVDFSRVHIWWGDERYLPTGHPDRNETSARAVMQSVVAIPPTHVHAMPSTDSGLGLDEAARAYAEELAGYSTNDSALPPFDLVLLGIGPRGHIASLYPDRPEVLVGDRTVVAVRDAPEPPPDRLSLSLPTLCTARRVWLLAAGPRRTDAVRAAWSGITDVVGCPASGARGTESTLLLTDSEAGAAATAR